MNFSRNLTSTPKYFSNKNVTRSSRLASVCAPFCCAIICVTALFHPSFIKAESLIPINITGATLVACGEIETNPSVATQEEKQTVHGYVFVMGAEETPHFKPGCPHITAKIGTQFGIQLQVNGSPELAIANVVTRVTHPPITNPETQKSSTVDQWDSPMNIGYARYAGWQFEDPWELVPGKWVIEILRGSKVLLRQEFEVATE